MGFIKKMSSLFYQINSLACFGLSMLLLRHLEKLPFKATHVIPKRFFCDVCFGCVQEKWFFNTKALGVARLNLYYLQASSSMISIL